MNAKRTLHGNSGPPKSRKNQAELEDETWAG